MFRVVSNVVVVDVEDEGGVEDCVCSHSSWDSGDHEQA